MLEVKNTCPHAEEVQLTKENDVKMEWIKCKLTERNCVCSYLLTGKLKFVMNGTYENCPGYVMNK